MYGYPRDSLVPRPHPPRAKGRGSGDIRRVFLVAWVDFVRQGSRVKYENYMRSRCYVCMRRRSVTYNSLLLESGQLSLVETMQCLVCASQTQPRKRSLISPASTKNIAIRRFSVERFRPGFLFADDSPAYVCRSPCFSVLEKGGKCLQQEEEVLKTLRDLSAQGVGLAVVDKTDQHFI